MQNPSNRSTKDREGHPKVHLGTQFRWACFLMVLPPFVMAFLPIMPATMTDKQLMADRSHSAEKYCMLEKVSKLCDRTAEKA
jgi:hypothetical protein